MLRSQYSWLIHPNVPRKPPHRTACARLDLERKAACGWGEDSQRRSRHQSEDLGEHPGSPWPSPVTCPPDRVPTLRRCKNRCPSPRRPVAYRLPQRCLVADGDEVPELRILRTLRPPASHQDRADRFFRERFITELANSAFRTDHFGDRHA